jgi:hypothetical protein
MRNALVWLVDMAAAGFYRGPFPCRWKAALCVWTFRRLGATLVGIRDERGRETRVPLEYFGEWICR